MAMKTRESRFATMDDLLESLGGISPARVRLDPPPGRATLRDVVRLNEEKDRIYELVDGTLVEKITGIKESFIACLLIRLIGDFSDAHGNLGMVLGEAGAVRLLKRYVRAPDVSFISWDRLPNRKVPSEPIPDLAPDLAVEVLSRKNTKREMARKLREYFRSGVRLVWYVDPRKRTVRVYTAIDDMVELVARDHLDGGEVLPGFRIPVARLFDELEDDRPQTGSRKKRRS